MRESVQHYSRRFKFSSFIRQLHSLVTLTGMRAGRTMLSMRHSEKRTDEHELIARVVALTYADRRSVVRELRGQRVGGRVGERIRLTLAALGHQQATGGTPENSTTSI